MINRANFSNLMCMERNSDTLNDISSTELQKKYLTNDGMSVDFRDVKNHDLSNPEIKIDFSAMPGYYEYYKQQHNNAKN